MANTKISDLTAASALVGTEKFAAADGTTTSKAATAAQIRDYVQANMTNAVASGYTDWSSLATPSAPGANVLRQWARNICGRMLPAWVGPSNLACEPQPALFGSQVLAAYPASGTTLASCMKMLGGDLTIAGGGTVQQVTPTSTSRVTQMRRTRLTNVVTTTNQVMGIHAASADMASFWRGNAAGLGGFFFFARFCLALWPAQTCRMFVGLRSGTTAVVASDTLAGHLCGFWHDTTMGATAVNFVTRDGTTTNTIAITVPTLGNDVGFDAYIFCPPNGSTIYYRLDNLSTGANIVDSSTATNLPGNTTFMAPECAVSNGTANVTAGTVAIAINKVYCESDV